jgi:beta-N-acetylhexosaminidase
MADGLLMLDLEGTELTGAEADLLRAPELGGVILFARNIHSVSQLQHLLASMRAVRHDLLIAVDQEGGRVQRVRDGVTRLPPLAMLGQRYAHDPVQALHLAHELGWLMAAEMGALGFDISFAPVLDLDHGHSNIIGDRAFASDPMQVVALANAYLDGMQEAGMAATGKHFPGHGWVAADSHLALPVDEREFACIAAQDLLPFRCLAARLSGVMPAHIVYAKVDAQPAGFSRVWLQDILRNNLGFGGVIFSDDLAMEGAASAGSFAQRAEQALQAGCDMVLVCNHREGALQVLEYLRDHAFSAKVSARQLGWRGPRQDWSDLLNSERRRHLQLLLESC